MPKARRAFERRFGASVLTLEFRAHGANPRLLRVHDPETGSWIDFDCSAWRIRRVAEHDAMAQA